MRDWKSADKVVVGCGKGNLKPTYEGLKVE